MTDDETNAATDERCNDLQTTLCSDGRHVNVRNSRSGSGEIHTVTLKDSGKVEGCTCKGWTYHRTCYHCDTVRDSPILVASAWACSTRQVATDGGHPTDECRVCGRDLPEDNPAHHGDMCALCHCRAVANLTYSDERFEADDEEHHAGGTPENTITNVHGDEVPARSEAPDMGGGETTGVVDLE